MTITRVAIIGLGLLGGSIGTTPELAPPAIPARLLSPSAIIFFSATAARSRDVEVEIDLARQAAQRFPVRLADQFVEPGRHRLLLGAEVPEPARFLEQIFREVDRRSHA